MRETVEQQAERAIGLLSSGAALVRRLLAENRWLRNDLYGLQMRFHALLKERDDLELELDIVNQQLRQLRDERDERETTQNKWMERFKAVLAEGEIVTFIDEILGTPAAPKHKT